jgi:hypothetical protein
MIHTGWIFDEDVKKVDDCRTHDFMKLVYIAGIGDELIRRVRASAAAKDGFVANWGITKLWSVAARYESRSETEARNLYSAITDEPDGVLIWIRNYW